MFVKVAEGVYVNTGFGNVEAIELDVFGGETDRVMLRFAGDGHGKLLPKDVKIEDVVKTLNDQIKESK